MIEKINSVVILLLLYKIYLRRFCDAEITFFNALIDILIIGISATNNRDF
ncbi:hypothetical protein KKG71_04555 [Patescibacteria group bacterium]|nr:hypothetical protein [Patescibacteria group bacterium]